MYESGSGPDSWSDEFVYIYGGLPKSGNAHMWQNRDFSDARGSYIIPAMETQICVKGKNPARLAARGWI